MVALALTDVKVCRNAATSEWELGGEDGGPHYPEPIAQSHTDCSPGEKLELNRRHLRFTIQRFLELFYSGLLPINLGSWLEMTNCPECVCAIQGQ